MQKQYLKAYAKFQKLKPKMTWQKMEMLLHEEIDLL